MSAAARLHGQCDLPVDRRKCTDAPAPQEDEVEEHESGQKIHQVPYHFSHGPVVKNHRHHHTVVKDLLVPNLVMLAVAALACVPERTSRCALYVVCWSGR